MCRQKDEGDVGGGGGWGAGKRGRTDARAGLGLTGAWLIPGASRWSPAGWPRVMRARDKHPVGANFLEQGVQVGKWRWERFWVFPLRSTVFCQPIFLTRDRHSNCAIRVGSRATYGSHMANDDQSDI